MGGVAGATGLATYMATAATTTSETDHSNDSATFTTTIVPKPPPPKRTSDLAITMKTTPSSLLVGSKVKYTIVVTNKGPVAAPATITDKLPAAMHFVSVSKPCTQKAGIVTCKLGTLAVGKKSKPVTLQVLAVGVGTVINTATVTGGKDPVTTNNISKVRNFVKTSLKEVKSKLAALGLSLGMNIEEFKQG